MLDIKANKWGSIDYKIDGANVELSFHVTTIGNPAKFNYMIAVRKYGQGGAANALLAFDKAPNSFHANFPAGEVLDTDKDGFTDEEEISIMETDPNVAEKWDDLNTVTGILNTPKKVSLYLDRKFKSVSRPSTPFATPVTELFKEMYGDCDEYAMLAIYWLARNGYKAYMLDIYFNQWWQEYNQWLEHDICVYQDKEDNQWYYIDIYFHNTGLNPVGSFKSVDEICDQLSPHYGATDWISYRLYNSDGSLVTTKEK